MNKKVQTTKNIELTGKLLEYLSKEDRPVAIAKEPKASKGSWEIIPVNF